MSAGSTMRRVSLRNIASHKVRLALTVLSVVLGTAFVTGSFVFTDTLKATFNGLFGDTYQHVDVRVTPRHSDTSGVSLRDVERIRAVPGVKRVQTEVSGTGVLLGANGKAVNAGGAPTEGLPYIAPADTMLEPIEIQSGRRPARTGEVALNSGALKVSKLSLGSRTRMLLPAQDPVPLTIVGVYRVKHDTGGYIGVVFTPEQARALFTDGKHVQAVDVQGDGVSAAVLRDRIAAALPVVKAQTGAQATKQTRNDVDHALSFVNYFLLAFGAIALLVGTFIIYNTFAMLVAQRLRELALLRAVGASRGQVSQSVLLEAAIVGLVGSVLGIGVGVALAYGLRALLNALNFGLPGGSLQLLPRTVIVALLVGVVVTVVSAYAPARRAAKIPPVAAMREEFASTGTSLRRRTLVAAVFGVLGVAGLVLGYLAKTAGSGASLVGLGALASIIAVLLGAPALSRPIIGGLGLITRPFGSVGRLARTNAIRNPRRTAATAFALTLGLMLVGAISVFGASTKQSINHLVDNGVTADYIVTGPNSIGVPITVGPVLAKVPGVGSAVSLHPAQVRVDGAATTGTAVEGDLNQVFKVPLRSGTTALTGAEIAASTTWAADHHLVVGSLLQTLTVDGVPATLTLAGIYADNQLLGPWVSSADLWKRVTPATARVNYVVLVKAASGTDSGALRTALERATDRFTVVTVQDREQFKGTQAKQVNALLGILYGLLALAIVIAILGIVNTLALSVVERRREIGMLRAMGMVRGQLRRTIYLESALIALFGALLGIALGLVFGALFVHTLRNQGLDQVSVPWQQAVVFLVISGAVGVLAALWPAVRAARTPPLAAISDL